MLFEDTADCPLPEQPEQAERNRYKLTIAYDGTDFHGWQKQKTTGPDSAQPLRTVAGVMEEKLSHVLRHPVAVVGASRTDAGVHARSQVAHVDADPPIPLDRIVMAVNSRLPDDIELLNFEVVARDFDAIKDAKNKQYRYRIFNTVRRPLDKRSVVWHCWTPLDVERMQDAALRLVGTHDFEAFAAAGHGRATTERTIFDCRVEQDQPEVHVVVQGDGFLYNMVRIIAGTLVEVGRGRFGPEVIDGLLELKDRSKAGPTLPPQGLCLEWIKY